MSKMKDVSVKEVMKPATTATRETTIKQALSMMKSSPGIISIVNEKGRLIGVVNESSFIKLVRHDSPMALSETMWFDTFEKESLKRPVDSIMNTKITTIKPHDNVATALKLMSTIRSRFLHVVDDDGRLLGIVRIRDIFEKLMGD